VRKEVDPEAAKKIEEYMEVLEEYIDGKHFPFSLLLEDHSGNSYVENPLAPNKDPQLQRTFYSRTLTDFIMMGY